MSVLRHRLADRSTINQAFLVGRLPMVRPSSNSCVCSEVDGIRMGDGAATHRVHGSAGVGLSARVRPATDRGRTGDRLHLPSWVRKTGQVPLSNALVAVGVDLYRAGQSIVRHTGSVGVYATAIT